MDSIRILVFIFVCIETAYARSIDITTYEECAHLPPRYSSYLCGKIEMQRGLLDSRVTWGHKLHDLEKFRVDSTLTASKQLQPKGPYSVGGGLDLTHKRTGSEVNVKAQHTKGRGNDLGIGATYNIFQHGDTSIKATGEATQHFGGPGGSTKPDYQVAIQLESKL